MCTETQTVPTSTGSASLDRVLTYGAVQKGKDLAEGVVASSVVLSSYIAPAAQKGLAVSIGVAGRVPGVKTVAHKVDEIGERTLQKLEDVSSSSQEMLTKYVKETLPLDRDENAEEDEGLSVSSVKERVVVNGQKVVTRVVPVSVQTVAGKSVKVAGTTIGAISTAYNGMSRENIKEAYNMCTVQNAKKLTKDTVKVAYNECTADNAKKVVNGSIATTKAVVDGTVATTKAVVGGTVAVTKTGVKVAGSTVKVAVKATNYAVGRGKAVEAVDAPEAEPETPVAEAK